MSHLGRWLSALIDGELDPIERDRVLNHLARCQPCLSEANAMRALKRRLTALGDTSADTAIASRLIEMVGSDRVLSAVSEPAGAPWSAFFDRSLALSRPVARPHLGRLRPFGQAWGVAAGSAGTALAVVGIVAFLLGSGAGEPTVPRVVPSVDAYLLQHAYDAGQEPASSGPASPAEPIGPGSFFPAQQGPAIWSGYAGQGQAEPGSASDPAPVTPDLVSPTASTPGSVDQSPATHVAHHTR